MRKARFKIRKVLVVFFMSSLLTFCFSESIYAYQFNSYVLSNPDNIQYSINASVGPFITDIGNFVEIWAGFCPETHFTDVSYGGQIVICGDLNTSTGYYAVCYHQNNDSHTITIYQLYTSLDSVEQHETIVHEVGHALGLAHCQAIYNSVSVMRANGFNDVPHPLSDDIAGIATLY